MANGIGWPNASAQTGPSTVIFFVDAVCGQGDVPEMTTNPVPVGTYNTGDYVYSPDLNARVLLGLEQTVPQVSTITIEGQIYPDCEE